MNMMIRNSTIPPQKGKVTYHQDQSITFVSFNTTNATPNKPITLTPELLLFLLIIIYLKGSTLHFDTLQLHLSATRGNTFLS